MVSRMDARQLWRVIVVYLWLHQCSARTDIRKLTGKWYPIAMVRADGIKEEMYAYTIEIVSNGDIFLVVEKPQRGRCKEMKTNLHAIKKVFMTTSAKDILRFVETDYKTYHIALAQHAKMLALFLYARRKKVPGDVKKRLKKLALKYGFNLKHIDYKPRVVLC